MIKWLALRNIYLKDVRFPKDTSDADLVQAKHGESSSVNATLYPTKVFKTFSALLNPWRMSL